MSASLKGLDMKQAVESQLQMFRNTFVGHLNFEAKGSGSSFNTTAAMKNLNLKGKMSATDAVFSSIDVGKMTTEALNNGIEKVGQKIPKLGGHKIKSLPNRNVPYQLISSDFECSQGTFTAPNFIGKAVPNKGIDLMGLTRVGLIDQSLVAHWKVIDTYNLTGARDLSVETNGVKVEHILAKGNEPVSFPVDVSGTLASPQYSYAQVPEYLAEVALSNTTGAAKQKLKAEGQKKAKEVISKAAEKAPAPVQDAIKKFGGGLFK